MSSRFDIYHFSAENTAHKLIGTAPMPIDGIPWLIRSPLLSKDQGQGQVKSGHEIKMLHDCRSTLVWGIEIDGYIHF